MDLLQHFSNPIVLPGRAIPKRERCSTPETLEDEVKDLGRDYADEIIRKEEAMYINYSKQVENSEDRVEDHGSVHGPMSDVDSTVVGTPIRGLMETVTSSSIYQHFDIERMKIDTTLPIFSKKSDILEAIVARSVVIIKGATGCGKTTQVPQYILQDAIEKKEDCWIVVTQPRRLAAISVAKRVNKEMGGYQLGSLVGYQIGQEKICSDETRILFCTTGVLLQKLISDYRNGKPKRTRFTHCIIDEVHERDQETDFLLIVLRKIMNIYSAPWKLIVMSATFSTGKFSDYLYVIYGGVKRNPFTVELTDTKRYNVKKAFADELYPKIIEAEKLLETPERPEISKDMYITAVRLVQLFDRLDETAVKDSVLIFLPGLYQIEEMNKYLRKEMHHLNPNVELWWIKPLHSSITHEEQNEVFSSPPHSWQRKIILSTNIAESSITVPDIKYVIDFCLTKTLVTDRDTSLTNLQLEWASKSSLEQRAGRVGRVSTGRVYRLISKKFYKILEYEMTPEILRCPLDRLVLQAKVLNMGSPKEILALAMSQPDLSNIKQAVATLKEIGALTIYRRIPKSNNEFVFDECDGDLTAMGKIISSLPMDVRLGKLIFLGYAFGVPDDCISMACAMTTKNIFSIPFQEYLKAYNSKLSWADSTCSDCIALLNAYKGWRRKKVQGGEFIKGNTERRWAKEQFVQLNALKEISILEKEIRGRLENSDLKPLQFVIEKPIAEPERSKWNAESSLCLKLAIAGAFYPNYFFKGIREGGFNEKEAVRTLGGNDPFTTVYLQGMPTNQPAILYKKSIEAQFEDVSNRVDVQFDGGSKIFVKFNRSNSSFTKIANNVPKRIPGKIEMAVYRAIKIRQTKMSIRIPILQPYEAHERYLKYVNSKKSTTNKDGTDVVKMFSWPWWKDAPLTDLNMEVHICHIESPSQFYIQEPTATAYFHLQNIFNILNRWNDKKQITGNEHLIPLHVNDTLSMGKIYFSAYKENDIEAFYRCRIVGKSKLQDKMLYNIYFVDFGNTKRVFANRIYDLDENLRRRHHLDIIPDLAVECSLAKIQPSNVADGWTQVAIRRMMNCLEKTVFVKVYSYVNGILAVKMVPPGQNKYNKKSTFNKMLIVEGHAKEVEESYLSQLDHEARIRLSKQNNYSYENDSTLKNINPYTLSTISDNDDVESPSKEECGKSEAILRGPYSPLEMVVHGVTKSAIAKRVGIEKDSVNSVLLDSNPSNSHERMLVAAFVGTNSNRDKLNLRHTTIMPDIPGLPALACLMFAPMVELRCDANYTKLSGAVCGLGYHANGKPIFPENDIEIRFDVELSLEDICRVNVIRYWLNVFAHPIEEREKNAVLNLRKRTTELFRKAFELQPLNFHFNAFKWNMIPKDKLLCPLAEVDRKHPLEDDKEIVYPLIWGISLNGDRNVERALVLKNEKEIRDLAQGTSSQKNIECKICAVTIENCATARLHLKNLQHKTRRKFFEVDDDDVNLV